EIVMRILVGEVQTELIDGVDLPEVIFSQPVVACARVSGRPGKLLGNHFDHFGIVARRRSDVVPGTETGEYQYGQYNGRNNSPGKFQVVVIRIKLCSSTLAILKTVREDKHDNTDDHKSRHGNSHGNPEQRICPCTVLGSHRWIVCIEIGE